MPDEQGGIKLLARRYKKGELETSIIFLLIGVFFLISSFFIESGNSPTISSAKMMPILLSIVMIVSSANTVIQVIKIKQESQTMEDVFQKRVLVYIGVLFVYIAGLFVLPFWLASVAFLLFSFWYWQSLPLIRAVVVSVATVAVTMVLFAKVFYITF